MNETEVKVEIKAEDNAKLGENETTPLRLRRLDENDETPLRTVGIPHSPDPTDFSTGCSGHGWESDHDDVEILSFPRTPRSELTKPNSPTNATEEPEEPLVKAQPEAPVVMAEPEVPVVKAEPAAAEVDFATVTAIIDELFDIIQKLELDEHGLSGIPSGFSNRDEINNMDLEPPQPATPDSTDNLEELEACREATQKALEELDQFKEEPDERKKKKRKHKRGESEESVAEKRTQSNSPVDDNQKENKRTSRDNKRTSEEHQRDRRRHHEHNPRDDRRHHEHNPRDDRRHHDDSHRYNRHQHEDKPRDKRPREDNHRLKRGDHDANPRDNRRHYEDNERESKRLREDHQSEKRRHQEHKQMAIKRLREDNQTEVEGKRDLRVRVTLNVLPRIATIKQAPTSAVDSDSEFEWIYVRDDERHIKVVNREKLCQQEQNEAVAETANPEPSPQKLTKREKGNLAESRAKQVLELFEQKKLDDQEEEFLMVDTIHKVPKSESFMSKEAFENPSPICNNYNVVYEFNSAPGTRIDLAKWGMEALPDSTRDLLRILAYDVDHLKQAQLKAQPNQRILKLKQEQLFNSPFSEPEEFDSAALYINASTQTDFRPHTHSVGTQAKLEGQPRGAFWQEPDFDMTFLTTPQMNVMFSLQELCRTLPSPAHACILYQALQPALDNKREFRSHK
ncbi:protein panoramix-like isoform X1 [Drosophila miranda]|uniref:protein panoramix-like isoform X1 n=1 Tax=Drosophila miranda TaxID=7229 RepID=UPI00143F9C5C|nr:protein panoramix-like isoform X1 [Drosophila miranda]